MTLCVVVVVVVSSDRGQDACCPPRGELADTPHKCELFMKTE